MGLLLPHAPAPLGLDGGAREGSERPGRPKMAPRRPQRAQDDFQDDSRWPNVAQYSSQHSGRHRRIPVCNPLGGRPRVGAKVATHLSIFGLSPTQPARQAITQPSRQAVTQPRRQATSQPERQATAQPARQATHQPARQATTQPARQATTQPARQATTQSQHTRLHSTKTTS